MSDKSYKPLKPHQCDCSGDDHPLDWCQSAQLREQLLEEIQALDQKLEALQQAGREIDFSLVQTCREMIQSRQRMFEKIRR